MKQRISINILIALVIMLVMVSCGSGADPIVDDNDEDTPSMTEDEARDLILASDCMWLDSIEDVEDADLEYEEPYWTLGTNYCLGKCRVDAETQEIDNDTNPMCTGAD
ncbi:MAG: hypothetical protein ABII18_00545 [bacterium]|nr:hypothetical protein [bacterium]MBU1918392.1 hypothetical protein [bacterium]